MCLNSLKVFKVRKNYGYKWFRCNKRIRTYNSPYQNYECYKLKRWYQAITLTGMIRADDWNNYRAGFHIYYTLKDARKSYLKRRDRVLCKVKFKDYITGYGDGGSGIKTKQIVAQQMLIVKRIK